MRKSTLPGIPPSDFDDRAGSFSPPSTDSCVHPLFLRSLPVLTYYIGYTYVRLDEGQNKGLGMQWKNDKRLRTLCEPDHLLTLRVHARPVLAPACLPGH